MKMDIKKGLPILAFMIAGTLAFTTEKDSSENTAFDTGYIYQNNQCISAPKNCAPAGGIVCTYLGLNVFKKRINATSCEEVLYEWQ